MNELKHEDVIKALEDCIEIGYFRECFLTEFDMLSVEDVMKGALCIIKDKGQDTQMTLEELKAEAKKHGYKLTKEYPYISLAPCVCGHKRIGSYMIYGKSKTPYFHKCYQCGFASEEARTKYEAKLKWNECVENARKEKENA